MAKLLYQGHASFRLTTDKGYVIYIDPYAGEGYDKPADLVLITHDHYDHNATHKVNLTSRTVIIQARDILVNGNYASYDCKGILIKSVPAYNSHHDRRECVGYLIKADGLTLYHAGDTDLIPEMGELASEGIDYALLPIDGFYTMSPEAASECARRIKCRRMIPMHMHPGLDFDMQQAMKVNYEGAMLVRPMQEIALEPKKEQ